MESELKKALNTKRLERFGNSTGGCISRSQAYRTDSATIFVKTNSKNEAKQMFDGELASLHAIESTNTIRVPKPILTLASSQSSHACIVTEYVSMTGNRRYSRLFGEQLARLHMHNDEMRKKAEKQSSFIANDKTELYIDRFGFDTITCCGYLPQTNDWHDNWPEFFTRNRLQVQIDLLLKTSGDRQLIELWSQLQLKIPQLFVGIIPNTITPALLHGDLWSGNCDETDDSPVIFDPASFYGHSEYEFGIATLFGGFDAQFYAAYHALIPTADGFDRRVQLYRLFHCLNHWNHFGDGYRSSSLDLMQSLVKTTTNK